MGWLLNHCRKSEYSDIKNSSKEEVKNCCSSNKHMASEWWEARIAVIKYNAARNSQKVSCWDF